MLVLSSRYPYPVRGGDKLRLHEICKALSRHYSLTLLSLSHSRKNPAPSDENAEIFDDIIVVHLPLYQSCLRSLIALASREPLQVAYYRSAEYKNKLKNLLNDK